MESFVGASFQVVIRWQRASTKSGQTFHRHIEHNIDIYKSLSQKDLNSLLNKSKVNVLFSKKEGSNRSIFEGFFANVPVIVLKNNIGMNKDYVNKHTGVLVDEYDVTRYLILFKNNWKHYTPRDWAMENISPLITIKKLNYILQSISTENGYSWTKDLVPKVNSPEMKLFSPLPVKY